MIWILLWLVCAPLNYGIALAANQREWPEIAKATYEGDVRFAAGTTLLGPIGIVISFFLLGHFRHGLMFRNPHKEEV